MTGRAGYAPFNKQLSPKRLTECLHDGTLGLPDFQRPSVWRASQQLDLLKSLEERLSIGVVTVWQVPVKARAKYQRAFFPNKGKNSTFQYLVLDGQQRLRALATLCSSSDPYQRPQRVLCVDRDGAVKARPSFEFSPDEGCAWVPTSVVAGGMPAWVNRLPRAQKNRLKLVREALNLDSIAVVVVPDIDYSKAIDLFERINSKGKRLDKKDLVAARLAETYPDYITECEEISRELTGDDQKGRLTCFDRTVITRVVAFAATGNSTSRASDAHEKIKAEVHDRRKGRKKRPLITKKWLNEARLAGNRLRNELLQNFGLGSRETASALDGSAAVVALQFLITHKKQPSPDQMRIFRRWLFLMLFSNFYTGGATETKVDEDMKAMSKGRVEWRKMFSRVSKPASLDGRGVIKRASSSSVTFVDFKKLSSSVKKRRYIEILRRLAIANVRISGWIDKDLVCRLDDRNSSLQHIFPRRPKNSHRMKKGNKLREHPANFAVIDSRENSSINNKAPSEYLPKLSKKALRQQQIPSNPRLWREESQGKFIDERTRLILNAVRAKYRTGNWG